MSVAFDETQAAFSLDLRLARGGQGEVWRLKGHDQFLVKIYHNRPSARETAKHHALRGKAEMLKAVAAMPISLAFNDKTLSNQTGIFIPFVGGSEIFELYGTRARLQHFPKATFKFLVRVAYNLAAAFEELHARDIVVGDVNEQNIKVLPDATIRLIDCDSFQIRDGREVYTSDVGTPLWTAPELHGRNLSGLERTQNHDLFGLAQLIFMLLFAGRNPFAGVPRTHRQMQPEEAIRQHAFAFAPPSMNLLLGPPPGSPKLEMLPQPMRDAFFKAFLKDSVRPNSRIQAGQWRLLLDQLSKDLVSCPHSPAHLFWSGSVSCPWCQVVRDVGVDLFPSMAGSMPNLSANTNADDGYILRLAGLRPHPFAITKPATFTDLRASPLPLRPTGLWNGLHQFFSRAGWKQSWLGKTIHNCRTAIHKCETQMTAFQIEQQGIIAGYLKNFSGESAALQKIVQVLRSTESVRMECRQSVENERQQEALKIYLQQFYIRKYKIPQIGPSRLSTVLSFGIETAADINTAALARAGLPSNAIVELVFWKKQREAQFKFDPKMLFSQAQLYEVERRFQERLKKVRGDATAIEIKLNQCTQQAQQKLRSAEAQIHQLARQRDQAKVDLAAAEYEMSRT